MRLGPLGSHHPAVPCSSSPPGAAARSPDDAGDRLPGPGTPVPGWVELTFTDGMLAPGQSTGPIQLRIHRPSWNNIDERDDPSWPAATSEWTEERPDHTGRRRGTRVRGHLHLTTPDRAPRPPTDVPQAGRPGPRSVRTARGHHQTTNRRLPRTYSDPSAALPFSSGLSRLPAAATGARPYRCDRAVSK